jgi:hypothetical protein
MVDYFFSGNRYIRVSRGDTGPGSVDAGYPAPISNWGWPSGFGANGIDAALYSGQFCYFFKGNQYVKSDRGQTGPGTVVAGPLPISDWGWPSGFGANGIDAALWSGPVCYFFVGNQYIRVQRGDGDFGKVDAGYPMTITGGWGWPAPFSNGIQGALPSGSVCYFFNAQQYLRVSRGIEAAGMLNTGYPANIVNWGWPAGFGTHGIDAALYSGGKLEPAPSSGLGSNFNYFLADGKNILTGVSVTINFDTDLVSTSNGFGFQLNCYSEEVAGNTTKPTWQQYIIYAEPNKTTLWGWIDNWYGTHPGEQQLINWEETLVTLPTANTIKAGSSLKMTLLNDSSNNVSGCTYSYTDPSGKVSSATINISDANLFNSTNKATSTNSAPIVALTFNIVADYNWNTTNFSSAEGSITYACNQPLTVLTSEPSYATFQDVTGELANTTYGKLPSTSPLNVSQIWGASPTPPTASPASTISGARRPLPPHVISADSGAVEQPKRVVLPPHQNPLV